VLTDLARLPEAEAAAVEVDVAVLNVRSGRLHALLVERTVEPQLGRWSLPGHIKASSESLDAAADRALGEMLGSGMEGSHVEQLASYGDPDRDPRGHVVVVAYLALLPEAWVPPPASGGIVARFWAVDDLAHGYGPALAFDHDRILADAVERVRSKLEYTTLATRFVPDPFTIGELFDVYRAVWGVDPGDKANFSRKVKGTQGFVVRTARTTAPSGRGRPSMLYTAGPATRLHPPILRPLRR
jgi:8-oxo-dGTP diphosphatase